MKNKKMENKYNKFILVFFLSFFILIISFVATIIYIDPFYHYHSPIAPIKFMQENEAYQNVGIAKNLVYDSILTGSSMTENFKVSQFNQLFECDTVKLSVSGGRLPNYEIILNEALKNDKIKIKNIFYGCDIYSYINDPNGAVEHEIPQYLYDDNIFTDVKYILNKTVMFSHALPLLKNSINNSIQDVDYSYVWYMDYNFSKTSAMKNYIRQNSEEKKPADIFDESVKINCEKIGKYIKQNPDIEFNIFFPPYSILYYDYFNRMGKLEALLYSQEMVTEYFLQFPNVKLSSFFADENIICNLDNYKDYSHYSERINEYMVKKMKTGEYELNNDNYKQYFEQARNFLCNYDYEQLFE